MRSLLVLVFLITGWVGYGQNSPDVVITTGHNDQINAMDITSDGRFLASASNDKQIKIWEVSSGMEFRTISGTDGRVEQVVFSSNNQFLAGTTFNEELFLWDVITGEVLHKGVASSGAGGLSFSADGKQLFYINYDANISVYDLMSKTTRTFENQYVANFIADTKGGFLYELDNLGNLLKVKMSTGEVVYKKRLFDSFNYPFSNSDITKNGKYIAYGFGDDKLRILDTETGVFVYVSKQYKEDKIKSLIFDLDKPIVYVATSAGDIVLFDYEAKRMIESGLLEQSMNVNALTAHPEGEIVVFGKGSKIILYDFKRKRIFREFTSRVNKIMNMSYDPKGRFLVTASDQLKLKIWDLELNRVVDSISAFFPCQFSADGKHIIAMTYQMTLGMFDIETGALIKSFNTDFELIQSLAVSPDGTKLAGAGFMNIVKIWDIESTKRIADLKGHNGGILSLAMHPFKPWVVSGSIDETSRVWDYEKGIEIAQFTEQTISVHAVKFSPNGKQLATGAWDKTIYLRNTTDWLTEKVLIGHDNIVNTIDYSQDGTVLISGGGNNSVATADNSVICWDTKTGKSVCRFKEHRGEIIKVVCDLNNTRFFSASVDGAIKYSDYGSCELIATYLAIGSKEFLVYTPDNYYIASRAATKGVAFRIKEKLVPFEQFDIHLNRPDIVADRIGKSPERLIKTYNYLYKKRLKKLNLEESSLKMDFNLPNIINESKFDIVTTQPSQKIWVKAWDDNYNLDIINLYVNNVPILGEKGFKIPANTKSIRKEIEIPLVQGSNKIIISCRNSNAVESLYENLEIIRDSDPEKHNLYVVSIGVSNYKDERFNLKYPTVDAEDILAKFKESGTRYKNVYTKLLVNEAVTVENITGLSEFFKNCTHEDVVVLFLAGHGVLNVDYDYFFGTYDMDFDSPDEKGLAYRKISSLLSKIKAYQKLLIMDTCHSGELDKEEIEEGPIFPEVEQGDVQFRGVPSGIRKKEGVGTDNMLKVTEDLFSDLRRGSGATVISSAGGAEYAMESDRWNNGLFTHVFIEGLSLAQKDSIYLSEIREYVYRVVNEESGGKQIPSSREENISVDYIIFGK